MKLKEVGNIGNNHKFIIYNNDIFRITWFSAISIMLGTGLLKRTKIKGLSYKDDDYQNMLELEVYDSWDECSSNSRLDICS